jgi:hypothetical protein
MTLNTRWIQIARKIIALKREVREVERELFRDLGHPEFPVILAKIAATENELEQLWNEVPEAERAAAQVEATAH